jgi:hypothetical protein
LASQQEFRKANEILNTVKRADGQNALLFDILDVCKISLDWWKRHKEWMFYRYPQLTFQKIEGKKYLIYTEPKP